MVPQANFVAKWPNNFDPNEPGILAEGGYISEGVQSVGLHWDVPLHVHPTGQLVHTLKGTLFIELKERSIPVCSGCAIWVPAGVEHCIRLVEGTSLLCFHPGTSFLPKLPQSPQLMILNPLAFELIRFFCLRRNFATRSPEQWERIIRTAVDEISFSSKLPSLFVTPTRNPKLLKVIDSLDDDELCKWNNAQWAKYFNMSEKTLGRLCVRETGLSFKKFRQHYTMVRSLQLLSELSVEETSEKVGYETLSSFISVFKEYFGMTPGVFKKQFDPDNRTI